MQKKVAIAITTLLFATTLTACGGTGLTAPTRTITQVTDGVDATIKKDGNLMYLRNVLVTVNGAGDANLIATIVNQVNTTDALVALAIAGKRIEIKALPAMMNKPIIFGGDSANASAVLPASGLVAGNRTTVSFFFGRAGEVSVDALIVNA